MNQGQVFQGNLVFFSSLPLFGPFITLFRSTPQVDNFGFLNFNHWLETVVERFEHLIFTLIHVTKLFHDLRKHIFICQNAPFWDFYFLWKAHDGFVKFLNPSKDGIDLESEAPPFGLFVVFFEHVDVFSAEVLPVADRLFNPFGFRYFLPENLKEGRLATADVSFNGEAVVFVLKLWIQVHAFNILIQTSR